MTNDTKGIFISYRRDESAGYAGRIADRLVEHFGEDRIFRDIDSIEPGLDFVEAIQNAVDSSEVLIVVIGQNWLAATNAAGQKRLETPDDYVRIEIATALQRNTRVIPLLVQGAVMPSAEELPEDLAPLTRRNAFELHESSWREEVQRLITTLDRVLGRRPVEEGPDRDSSARRDNYMSAPPQIVVVTAVLLALLSLLNLISPLFTSGGAWEGPGLFYDAFTVGVGVAGLIAAGGLWMRKRWSVWLTITVCVLSFILVFPSSPAIFWLARLIGSVSIFVLLLRASFRQSGQFT
jgi:TIR domain